MAPSIKTECGVSDAAFERAAARLDVLRKINAQCETIDEMRARHANQEKRELAFLMQLRAEAEKLGAYELLENPARRLLDSIQAVGVAS